MRGRLEGFDGVAEEEEVFVAAFPAYVAPVAAVLALSDDFGTHI